MVFRSVASVFLRGISPKKQMSLLVLRMVFGMRFLYVFMGKSATGKDTLFDETLKRHPELKKLVTYTTRPIREGERDGDEYFFTDEDVLKDLEDKGRVIEVRKYDTAKGAWYYFTAADPSYLEDDSDYCLISTLEGYLKLRAYFGEKTVKPIYIEVSDITRIERSVGREKKEKTPCIAEVCRRYLADEEDFAEEKLELNGITDRVVNDNKQKALEQIDKILEKSVKM